MAGTALQRRNTSMNTQQPSTIAAGLGPHMTGIFPARIASQVSSWGFHGIPVMDDDNIQYIDWLVVDLPL